MGRFRKARRSVVAFCRAEGVSEASFYQWRRRLAGPSAVARGEAARTHRDFTPVPAKEMAGFTPVQLVAAAGVAVHLPGGTQLQVPISDRQALRLVIDRLARADARRAGGGAC